MMNHDMNALRAKNGYLVGFEDMEENISKMIQKAYLNSFEIKEKFDLMKTEFSDLKKEVIEIIEHRMDRVRFETRGALQQQLTFIEESSANST
mmetsp:Transcript_21559/g.33204  ORF Transcript_21559/g.33204 Transcript_21559/m.33204 type:complete len:93 (+) Transcript_21559:352-630(+)